LFLALRLVDGPDLRALLQEDGPLSVQDTVAILSQIGGALDAAHERALVHRDVKPANVLLERGEHGWHAYLADFGLAKPGADSGEHTVAGEILGTVDYIAPEQINGDPLDGRADVYSFGCMVYRCLVGEPPYKRQTRTATLLAHVNAPVPLPSRAVADLPEPLDLVVARALEKDPQKRARSAGALMRWAASQLNAEATGNPPPGEAPDEEPLEEIEDRKRSWRHAIRAPLFAAAAYAPVWLGGYLLGRKI
jgi:serine/threonine-protein kinase